MTVKHTPLPDERSGITKTFKLRYQHSDGRPDVMKFYFTASTYPDGRLGEVFVKADKSGSLASGALNTAAILISMGLQHGIALETLLAKLRHTTFAPNGFTGDPMIPSCSSPVDLLAQWLALKFGGSSTPG